MTLFIHSNDDDDVVMLPPPKRQCINDAVTEELTSTNLNSTSLATIDDDITDEMLNEVSMEVVNSLPIYENILDEVMKQKMLPFKRLELMQKLFFACEALDNSAIAYLAGLLDAVEERVFCVIDGTACLGKSNFLKSDKGSDFVTSFVGDFAQVCENNPTLKLENKKTDFFPNCYYEAIQHADTFKFLTAKGSIIFKDRNFSSSFIYNCMYADDNLDKMIANDLSHDYLKCLRNNHHNMLEFLLRPIFEEYYKNVCVLTFISSELSTVKRRMIERNSNLDIKTEAFVHAQNKFFSFIGSYYGWRIVDVKKRFILAEHVIEGIVNFLSYDVIDKILSK